MLNYWSIKKYGTKLLPTLEKRFGKQDYFDANQIRSTVYQKDFNPKHLPLAYILFLSPESLSTVMANEFPDLDINAYKKEMLDYLSSKSYQGYLQVLAQ